MAKNDFDPEAQLDFKLDRSQFNHRLPKKLINLFEEFNPKGRKYLLEYLVWLASKTFGTRLATFDELSRMMLERYMEAVKKILVNKMSLQKLSDFEELLDQQAVAALKEKAKKFTEENPEIEKE
ncbi:MAG: hypothetical protein ACFFCS_24140 [Candidatus Hodarchaeota archaeon]